MTMIRTDEHRDFLKRVSIKIILLEVGSYLLHVVEHFLPWSRIRFKECTLMQSLVFSLSVLFKASTCQ